MNNTITTKTSHRIRITYLCLPVIAALILAAASQPAWAKDQVPFRAAFDAVAESTLDFPMLHSHLTGEGHATHLGLTIFETTDQALNILNNQGTATYYFTGANGDQIVVFFDFTALPVPTGFTLSGTWKITGGTGRFAGASGSGTMDGWAFITATAEGGHFTMTGTISSPGSLSR